MSHRYRLLAKRDRLERSDGSQRRNRHRQREEKIVSRLQARRTMRPPQPFKHPFMQLQNDMFVALYIFELL